MANWMNDIVKKPGAFRSWCLEHGFKKANGEPDTKAGARAVASGDVKTSAHVRRMATLAQTFAKFRE